MHADDLAALGERLDVAPYRLQRHAEPDGEVADADGALFLQEAEDLRVPRRGIHAVTTFSMPCLLDM